MTMPSGPAFPASPTNVPRVGDFGHAPSGTSIQDVTGQFTKGGFGWAWEGLDAVIALPQRFEDAINTGIANSVREIADEMTAYAKENAPWEDRTGDAREGLKAVPVQDAINGTYSIFLGYSVDYGIYLETYNGGVLAITRPTVERFAPILNARVRDRVAR